MKKKLADLILFVSGNPLSEFPENVFMSYRTSVDDVGKSAQKQYRLIDPDPTKSIEEIWLEIVDGIKNQEGIE
jgi:hypothetical protein